MIALPIIKHIFGIGDISNTIQSPIWYQFIASIPEWAWWAVTLVIFFIINLVVFHNIRIERDNILKTYLDVAEKNKDKFPITADLRISQIAWGLWYTGTTAHSEKVFDCKKLTRLLILKPGSDTFKENMRQSGEDEQLGRTMIETVVRDALIAGVKVGQYSALHDIPDSMTIFDEKPCKKLKGEYMPNSRNAWIVAKVFMRDVPVSERQLLRLKREDNRFNAYFKQFEEIWQGSDRVALENNEIIIKGKWGD